MFPNTEGQAKFFLIVLAVIMAGFAAMVIYFGGSLRKLGE